MSTIQDFLLPKESFQETQEVKLDRYPKPFVIKSITQDENDAIKRANTIQRRNKSGVIVPQTNYDKYMDAMIAACVVEPDLRAAELQEYYGTSGDSVGTLKAMLFAGEYMTLMQKVQETNGFLDEDMDDLMDEVKND